MADSLRRRPRRRGRGWRALLNDWELSGVLTLQSGLPLPVIQAINFNGFAGFGTQRPNLVGDPELPAGERSAARWFDTGAFELAPQFTLGSSSRNPVRGPGFRTLDLALVRRLPVGATTLEWRLEMFNALNATNLGPPNAVLGRRASDRSRPRAIRGSRSSDSRSTSETPGPAGGRQ